jgi:DHA1 family chloramphenicol resistance protein-like MFS transporter
MARWTRHRAGAGYPAVGWIGAVLGMLAFGTILVAARLPANQRADETASSITGA